jgi:hypothetical protein
MSHSVWLSVLPGCPHSQAREPDPAKEKDDSADTEACAATRWVVRRLTGLNEKKESHQGESHNPCPKHSHGELATAGLHRTTVPKAVSAKPACQRERRRRPGRVGAEARLPGSRTAPSRTSALLSNDASTRPDPRSPKKAARVDSDE